VQLTPGTTVGPYRIDCFLAAGGMGQVYRARDLRLRRNVALKIVRARSADDEHQRRLLREARAASALSHANAVAIYDIVESEIGLAIVMELVQGQTLDEIVSKARLTDTQIYAYARQIAAGLAAAHALGITHRDLKPSNVMVTEEGQVKLLDFGIAKAANVPPSPDQQTQTVEVETERDVIMGTPAYMSPEQVLGRPVDVRSDVFSFGSVLYELVTGTRAFKGESPTSVMAAVLRDDPSLPAEPQRVDAGLAEVIRRCLRKDPAGRFANGQELLTALSAAQANVSAQRGSYKPPWVGIAIAALLFATGVGLWWLAKRPVVRTVQGKPLTSLRGSESHASFSPDGELIAFSWDGGSAARPDVYVRKVSGGDLQRLTTQGGSAPVWSPDGKQIAFVRSGPEGNQALVVSPGGGTERNVAPIAGAVIAWTPDSKHLVVPQKLATGQGRLVAIGIDSGRIAPLSAPPANNIADMCPAFSPDGARLAFVRYAELGTAFIYAGAVAGTPPTFTEEPVRLTKQGRNIFGIAWSPSGEHIVMSSSRGGPTGLWRIAATGGDPIRIEGIQEASSPAIAPSKRLLAYTWSRNSISIWRAPGPAAGPGVNPERLLTGAGFGDLAPQYSPDGKKIAFFSARSGAFEIWVSDSNGNDPIQLTRFDGPLTGLPQWSPDSRRLVFDTRPDSNADVYWIDATGGGPHPVITESSEDVTPTWSRDGEWIYYASNRSGRFEIWKAPAPSAGAPAAAPVQVTSAGGYSPHFSLDGKRLFYTRTRTDPKGLYEMDLDTAAESLIEENAGGSMYGHWTASATGLYFVANSPGREVSLRFFDFARRQVQPFAKLEGPVIRSSPGISLSPDGKWFAYSRPETLGSDLMLVENFH
jgi:serine/threonine protein kinase/dipeptidyl aminopeptidase/acylaminoacyl peptidase